MKNFEEDDYLDTIRRIDKIFEMSYSKEHVETLKNNGGLFLLT